MNRISTTISAIAACTIALAACGRQGGGEEASGPAPGGPEAEIVIPEDVSIPSPEEAAAEAARTITEDNADAAFEDLVREIEATGGDDG